ncbi:hypothetical protein ACFV4P_02475 [Kitasatospora sp. NPDC059795]|uniref:hypothetical protein n=1 Tax=Kitasatospora sp. NPDC059795 TaxID=3346949 RepID=UPI0036479FEE
MQPGSPPAATPPNRSGRRRPLGTRQLTVKEAATFLRGTFEVPAEFAAVERLALLTGLRPGEIADLAEHGRVERHGPRWHVTVPDGKCPRTIAVARLAGDEPPFCAASVR